MSIERMASSGLQLLEAAPLADGLQLQPPLSWSIWACLPEAPTGSTIRSVFSFSTTAGVGLSGYNLMALNSKMHFYLRTSPPVSWCVRSAPSNVLAGEWHHYAGRVSVESDVLYQSLWIDGSSSGVNTVTPAPDVQYDATVTLKLHVGAYITNYLHCLVQDFAVWDVELATEEIRWIARSKRAGGAAMIRPADQIGFWTFDEMNNGEDCVDNPKYFYNKSGGTGGAFEPVGSGHMYGGLIPLSYSLSARIVESKAPTIPQTVDLDVLTSASSAQGLIVAPGAVAIVMGSAEAALSAKPITVATGEVIRPMDAIGLTGTPLSLQIIPGELVTALSALTASGQARTIATTHGPVTISLDRAIIASSAMSLNVTPGEFITQMAALTAEFFPKNLTVIPASVSIPLDALTLQVSAQNLNVVPGAVIIDADVLALASTAQAVVILPGAISVPLDAVSLASQAPVIIITNGVAILLAPLSMLGSAQNISILPGAVSIGAAVLGMNATAQSLQVFAVKLIEMGALVATSTAQVVSVLPGATSRNMAASSLALSVPAIDVVPGPISELLAALTLTGSAGHVVIPHDVQVVLDALMLAASAPNVRGMFGIRVYAEPAQLAATVRPLRTMGGALTLPGSRKVIVPAENRILTAPEWDRP